MLLLLLVMGVTPGSTCVWCAAVYYCTRSFLSDALSVKLNLGPVA